MNSRSLASRYLVNLNDYRMVNSSPISRGSFENVYLVENNSTHEKFAAQVSVQDSELTEDNEFIAQQISILIRFKAPTIIPFHGFSLTDFQGSPHVTILTNYMPNSSLRHFIELESNGQAPPEYSNTAKQIILCGIAHGLMILHSRRVLHRNLKPENILLDSNFHPYITDFYLSTFIDPDNTEGQSMSGCGTLVYMAPEVAEDVFYGLKADIYSFGILMYEVLMGEAAYANELKTKNFHVMAFQNRVIHGERPVMDSRVKPSFQELIKRCWSPNVRDRPTSQELFTKLSLSFEDDESTVNSIKQILSGHGYEEPEQEYNPKYCLDDVDIDKVLTYAKEITENPNECKRIFELEQQIQHYQQENESLKMQLKEMNDQKKKVLE